MGIKDLFDYFDNKKVLIKILEKVLNLKKEDIFKNLEKNITEIEYKTIKSYYEDYEIKKKPLEYILNEVEFYWLKWKIDERALIPRPETEYLVRYAIEYIDKLNPKYIIDIWTWSWVIWLSLAYQRPQYTYILSDISQDALDLAYENYLKIIKDKVNVIFIKSDLLSDIPYKNWSLIVSNLPYIPDEVFYEMEAFSSIKWEPNIAFLWWKDWLDIYRRLIDQLNFDFKWLIFEALSWQIDILRKYTNYEIKILDTFHFNIKIGFLWNIF